MTTTDPELALTDVLSPGDVAMMTSRVEGVSGMELRARPLTCVEVEGDRLTFMVSAEADWVADLAARPVSGDVVVTRDHGRRYVAVSGRAAVSDDRTRVEGIWSRTAEAYFTGPDDPRIRLLDVAVDGGEWWSAPTSAVGTALSLVGTVVLGRPAHSGSRGDVTTG